MSETASSGGGAVTPASGKEKGKETSWAERAVVETDLPFGTVKEAVEHFGGSGHWKDGRVNTSPVLQSSSPHSENHQCTDANLSIVDEETKQLNKDLIVKEHETLEILEELERTKKFLVSLRMKMREETHGALHSDKKTDCSKGHPLTGSEHGAHNLSKLNQALEKPSPGSILMELKQAKLNLSRATTNFAGIRSSIKDLKCELDKEKISMEKTRKVIAIKTGQISTFERELSQSKLLLQLAKNSSIESNTKPPHISRMLHELRSETEQFKRMAAASESEVLKMTQKVGRNKSVTKTLEVREVASKEERACNAMKTAAFTKNKALKNQTSVATLQHSSDVTMTLEEYNMLVQNAQKAEAHSKKKIEAAMVQVAEANKTKIELFKKVEEANMEIRNSRKALGEALLRVDAANNKKQVVEEALQKWREEHGQKRRSVHSSPRFKNSFPCHHRRDHKILDRIGLSPTTNAPMSVLKPTVSIGQLLSGKLVDPEEMQTVNAEYVIERAKLSPRISLGQMLSRSQWSFASEKIGNTAAPRKSFHAKKKKLGFVGNFSLVLFNHNRKNKKKRTGAWSPK